MKKEDLFEALDGIDENSIEEARQYVGKRKLMRRVRWMSLAACAALFLMTAVAVPIAHRVQSNSAEEYKSTDAAEEMYEAAGTDAAEEAYDAAGADAAEAMYDAADAEAADETYEAANADAGKNAAAEAAEAEDGAFDAASGGGKADAASDAAGEKENAESMANAGALPESALNGIKQTAAEYPPAVCGTMSAQEFADSEEHWKWWESYLPKAKASEEYQDGLRGYYQDLMAEILVPDGNSAEESADAGSGNKTGKNGPENRADSENTVCSPLNTFVAFAMLAEVTDGNTRQQILDLLNVRDMDYLHEQIKAVWESNYVNTPLLSSLLADSMWLRDGAEYNEDTLKNLADRYFASTFRGEMGSDEMNRALQMWTDANTGGLLGEYTKNMKMDANTVLAIVSTIYYKAAWTDAFLSQNTTKEIFHGIDGDTTVDMMHHSDMMEVCRTDTFTSVGLGLSDSGSMYFYLPAEGVDVNELVRDPDLLKVISSGGDGVDGNKSGDGSSVSRSQPMVNLSVPKFRVSGKTDLLETLRALGVTDVQDPSLADFTPLTSRTNDMYLGSAEHAAMVEVDEDGVTGAAYTEMAVLERAMEPGEVLDFVIDRPFLFVITGRDGSVLFSGIVRSI